MGDRVYVTIKIHKDYLPLLIQLGGGSQNKLRDKVGYEEMSEKDDIVSIYQSEINYGEWDVLQDLLQKGDIEYDKIWGAGCEFEEGESFFRKIQGKWQLLEITSSELNSINLLELLLQAKDVRLEAESMLLKLRPFEIKPLHDGKSNAEKFIEQT